MPRVYSASCLRTTGIASPLWPRIAQVVAKWMDSAPLILMQTTVCRLFGPSFAFLSHIMHSATKQCNCKMCFGIQNIDATWHTDWVTWSVWFSPIYLYANTVLHKRLLPDFFLSGVEQYFSGFLTIFLWTLVFTHFESTPKYSYIQKNICALSHLALTWII